MRLKLQEERRATATLASMMCLLHLMNSRTLLQLLASLCINEHIAVCSQYEISAANVSMDSVKCYVWSVFEQSVLPDFHL